MTFILRWPAILILLALLAASLVGALAITAARLDLVDLNTISPEAAAVASTATWLEAGLWYGAAVFFLIAMVRLIRRTQAFWAWLLGFALYGGRWAVTQDSDQLVSSVRGLNVDSFQPETLAADTAGPAAQVSLLAIVLAVGLLILVIDAADRAYWDRQAA